MSSQHKLPYILLLMVLALLSCKKDNTDEELKAKEKQFLEQYLADNSITQDPKPSGMYHIILEAGSGANPVPDSWVDIQFAGRLVDGTLFETNIESIAQSEGLYDPGFVYGLTRLFVSDISMKGLQEGIQYMTVGEKARLIIPSDLGTGGDSRPLIPPFSTLIFDVTLLDEFKDPAAHQRDEIIAWLGDPLLYADTLQEGIYYFEEEHGWGDTITMGDEVEIRYLGSFLDGRIFDSNTGAPLPLLIQFMDQDDVIPGIMNALKYMRGGAKGRVVIPYQHAYGRNGAVNDLGQTVVPPYMPLLYNIEVETVF